MLRHFGVIACVVLGLQCNTATSQVPGEENEPTPEYVDANFGEDDAARMAAGFSDRVPSELVGRNLVGMTSAADLVVRGLVLAQEYHYDVQDVPSTHTTFLVSEELKGNHAATQVTLVQRGGPAKDNADKIMMSSHSHYFNVGEEEVLFLETDPENSSPFQRVSVMSRYRVFKGKLYSDDGRSVILFPLQNGDDYRIAHGVDRNPDSRFKHIQIGTRRLGKTFDQVDLTDPQVRRAAAGKSRVEKAVREAVDVAAFVNLVKKFGGRGQ